MQVVSSGQCSSTSRSSAGALPLRALPENWLLSVVRASRPAGSNWPALGRSADRLLRGPRRRSVEGAGPARRQGPPRPGPGRGASGCSFRPRADASRSRRGRPARPRVPGSARSRHGRRGRSERGVRTGRPVPLRPRHRSTARVPEAIDGSRGDLRRRGTPCLGPGGIRCPRHLLGGAAVLRGPRAGSEGHCVRSSMRSCRPGRAQPRASSAASSRATPSSPGQIRSSGCSGGS